MIKKKVHILWFLWCPLFLVLLWQVYILTVVDSVNYLERMEYVYSSRIDALAKSFNLSPAYLKALIILECSGKYSVAPRFEESVFKRFKKIRAQGRGSYNGITSEMIHNASDDALRNMATSWGPFQIMGSHAVLMGINVRDLRGINALYWGVKWIDMNYGDYLRKGAFKDAFHLHNTGKPFPENGIATTHDPNYIDNGMKYMKYFQKDKERSSSSSHRL